MKNKLEKEIEDHKLSGRVNCGAKIKWITPIELLALYGDDIEPIQREIILQDLDMRYPISK